MLLFGALNNGSSNSNKGTKTAAFTVNTIILIVVSGSLVLKFNGVAAGSTTVEDNAEDCVLLDGSKSCYKSTYKALLGTALFGLRDSSEQTPVVVKRTKRRAYQDPVGYWLRIEGENGAPDEDVWIPGEKPPEEAGYWLNNVPGERRGDPKRTVWFPKAPKTTARKASNRPPPPPPYSPPAQTSSRRPPPPPLSSRAPPSPPPKRHRPPPPPPPVSPPAYAAGTSLASNRPPPPRSVAMGSAAASGAYRGRWRPQYGPDFQYEGEREEDQWDRDRGEGWWPMYLHFRERLAFLKVIKDVRLRKLARAEHKWRERGVSRSEVATIVDCERECPIAHKSLALHNKDKCELVHEIAHCAGPEVRSAVCIKDCCCAALRNQSKIFGVVVHKDWW